MLLRIRTIHYSCAAISHIIGDTLLEHLFYVTEMKDLNLTTARWVFRASYVTLTKYLSSTGCAASTLRYGMGTVEYPWNEHLRK